MRTISSYESVSGPASSNERLRGPDAISAATTQSATSSAQIGW